MKKFFGLFLLALAFLVPGIAEAANCFWVGGSGTWDNTNTGGGGAGGIKWASASGGGTACAATSGPAAGVPGPSDTATIDAHASGLNGGTITVSGATINVISITAGAANGTINFGTNDVTTSGNPGVNFSGTGTRTINMGSGTWTFTSASAATIFDNSTQTNCTSCVYSNAALVFTANAAGLRTFNMGTGVTYGNVTVSSNSTKGVFALSGASTIASLTVDSGNTVLLTQLITVTVTGAINLTGTASAPVGLVSSSAGTNVATISVGSASTINWGAIVGVTKSGAGSITATNSFDLGRNTSITISPPSGGGGGGRIIGG